MTPRRYVLQKLQLALMLHCAAFGVLTFGCRTVMAQTGGATSIFMSSTTARDNVQINEMNQKALTASFPSRTSVFMCSFEPYVGALASVSVRTLKARDQYEKACDSYGSRKYADAEKHLRKGLERSPADGFGWVMLGKIMIITDRLEEATKACVAAVSNQPSYWPATVCLAEIEGRKHNWKQSFEHSERAIALDPSSKAIAYYISAVALLNLNNTPEAERRALEAKRLEGAHQFKPTRLILARIYEDRGDILAAMSQLREYLTGPEKGAEEKEVVAELARLKTLHK